MNAEQKKLFAYNLRQRIIDANLSASDVARRIWDTTYTDARGFSCVKHRDRVASWQAGKSFPSPINLAKLAKALRCTVEDLMPAGEKEVLSISTDGAGRCRVKIDQTVTPAQAVKIMEILSAPK